MGPDGKWSNRETDDGCDDDASAPLSVAIFARTYLCIHMSDKDMADAFLHTLMHATARDNVWREI